MIRSIRAAVLGTAALLGVLSFGESEARADLSACGNISVSANSHCELVTSGGCTAKCTPVSFEAACAAKLETTCDGKCTVTAEASCQGTCDADCEGKCTVDAGSYDCQGSCEGSCSADCSAKCSGSASASGNTAEAQGQCEASCKSCCTGHCSAKCKVTPPSADCKAKCSASCQGSCEGKANAECQIKCQSSGYASCQANLMGGCTTQCSQPKGALFCDGQYVDVGNNLDNCLAALEAEFHVQASGQASCSGNNCTANGKASASCAVTEPGLDGSGAPLSGGALLAGLGGVGVALVRRRKASRVQ